MKFVFTLFMLLSFVQPVIADEVLTSSIKGVLKHTVESNYWSVLLALGVVIVLIYLTGIIYAKLNVLGYKTLKKEYKDIEKSKIIILSTTQLGQNKFLYVIELAGKKMLIGVSNENITLLKDLSEEKIVLENDEVNKSHLKDELFISEDLVDLYKEKAESVKNNVNTEKCNDVENCNESCVEVINEANTFYKKSERLEKSDDLDDSTELKDLEDTEDSCLYKKYL